VYEDRSRRLRYVNCGHVAPLLRRASGEVDRLEPTATMLGAFKDWECTEETVVLDAGDRLVIYSDGVTEAGIDTGEEFGEDRLVRLLGRDASASAASLVQSIVDDVVEFSGPERHDDVTVVCVVA
jgi:serine phosphatase RsbU (regulator of sigma subunit)